MKKKLLLTLFLLFIFGSFCFGFFTGVKQTFPYNWIKDSYILTFNALRGFQDLNATTTDDEFWEICMIPEIETLPFDSTVFVGHAYGAAESVEQFLRSNQTRLTRVIFTGDVFGIPSAKKWDDLASFFQTTTEIHIAPGNHDVQRSDSRDVFLQSPFGNRSYPYIIPMAHSPIVIENSTSSDWLVDQSIFDLINLSDTDLLIARHNVPVKELLAYANSRAGQSKALDSFQELKQAANSDFFVTWVIGDSGAFEQLPRLACFERDGHRFILNGVGGMSGDSVLVVKGKDFFSFKIN